MVAYNFQAQFAPAVEAGLKLQTIRAQGKRKHAQPGDVLQLYTGMRQKTCRLLRKATCLISTYCSITEDGITTGNFPAMDLDLFAKSDGFRDFAHMKQWFRDTHGLPFTGRLIVWSAGSI
jgi:hypothetical protein